MNIFKHQVLYYLLDESPLHINNYSEKKTDKDLLCKIYRKENIKLREENDELKYKIKDLSEKLNSTIEENEKSTDLLYTELENYRVFYFILRLIQLI